jgi:glutamyl-Q tRNA(Asp) synthetase
MPLSPPYRGRFAPSPTGDLHFGSLIAALGSWLRARAAGGTWLVRMEDLDPPREVPGAAQRILATLDAFGLRSDEPVEYQSRRQALYARALELLVASGHAFSCRCSRRDLGDDAVHRGCVPGADPTRAPAWRVRAPDLEVAFEDLLRGHQAQNLAREVGDVVVRRVDGLYAYQLAVVVDDAAQGITEVVRGADLLASTPRQIWLQRLLGLPTPAYLHLPLAVDAGGAKLSKQCASAAVDPGDPLPALRQALVFLGCAPSMVAGGARVERLLRDAVEAFDLAQVPRRATIVV